ncbi:MAG: hypothetical protein DCF25_18170 [Leptolyngbya foveolarum]|uniref:AAA family ATPase n=1 Tax=Leptolyngbya foveolarum TaxID=47253 RepID=A0A2W4U4D5_9CYAN|nr:MAG: hypothetical protein DCF25_18170 [Leptolyngbya foveolarum]
MGIVKSRKIIFVGGVHGVGKTTLCNKVKDEFEIKHFSASNLISREKNGEKESHRKQVADISGNQNHLAVAVNRYFNNVDWYLLDGHFCLLDRNKDIALIPHSIYEEISPSAIIVLVDEPKSIYSRLSARDNVDYDLSLLRSFQEQEISQAKLVSQQLAIPYLIVNPNQNENKALAFIGNLVV